MSSQLFPNQDAGSQQVPSLVRQKDQLQQQLDWLTECVFALQEQNRQLYEQVAMLNKALQQMVSSNSGISEEKKENQGWTKEDEEMAKLWEKRGVVPCVKGKPIDYDKWIAAKKKQEKTIKGSQKVAKAQVPLEKCKENTVQPKNCVSGKGQDTPKAQQ